MSRWAGANGLAWVLLGVVFCAGCTAQERRPPGHPDFEPPEAQKQLWEEHIRGRDNHRMLDNFEIIEGALLTAVGDIEPRTAALATAAFQAQGPEVARFSLSYRKVLAYASEYKDAAVNEEQQVALKKIPERAAELYGDTSAMPHYVTHNLGHAMLLQRSIEDADTIAECLERIARRHGWVATHEKSAEAGFGAFKTAIDGGVPVVLESTGPDGKTTWAVCFGYLETDGKRYLATERPDRMPLQKGRPPSMTEKEKAARLTSQRVRNWVEASNNTLKKAPWDLLMSTEKPLARGMTLEEFTRGRYTAHFIHHWRNSAEGWHDEIVKIMGPPE